MAMRALRRMAPVWYTPDSQKDDPNPTRFKIRGLNGTEQGYIQPELKINETTRMVDGMSGRGLEQTLGYGLLDWENLVDEDGSSQIAYSPLNFGRIDLITRTELAMQILAASFVSPEEKKT